MFGRIITGFFWDTYDNLGRILLANILWFVINIPGLIILISLLNAPAYLGIYWILLSIPYISITISTGGLYHYTFLLVQQKDITIWEYIIGIKKYAIKSLLYSLFFVFIYIVLLINMQFYISLDAGFQWFGVVLAGLAFWISIFLLLVIQYFYPLMVRDNISIRKLSWRAILLVLDNLWLSLLLFFTALGLFLLSILTGIGPILFTMTLWTLFYNNALFEIMEKYKLKEIEPVLPAGEKPVSWHQILKKEKPQWRHENRGWKDIIRPWDM